MERIKDLRENGELDNTVGELDTEVNTEQGLKAA